MSKYVYTVTDDSVMVVDTHNGEQVKLFNDNVNFLLALEMVREGNYEDVFDLDAKHVVEGFISDDSDMVSIHIEDGVGTVELHEHGISVPLEDAITNRIIKMDAQGFDYIPMANFINNLYKNPSSTAVKELYGFIEACELPITEDGCFIAYKIVKNDYTDIYTGTIDNSVGSICSMPRHMVDDKRENTCSHGLHFCSKEYLSHYGSSARNNDRCLLVKIDPADVVSIPSDYDNAKGRTWKYEVVGEVEGKWRDTLPTTDYTDSAVVDYEGCDCEDLDSAETWDSDGNQDTFALISDSEYWFDASFGKGQWKDRTGKFVSRDKICYDLNVSLDYLHEYEAA